MANLLDTQTADLLVMQVKLPDHPTKHFEIRLIPSPSSRLWARWNGTYHDSRGEHFDVTVQHSKAVKDRWSMIIIHKSRFYGRNKLRRLDLGPHTDQVTGRVFSQDVPHLHFYREDWLAQGYPDEVGYAEEQPGCQIQVHLAWGTFMSTCGLTETLFVHQGSLF